METCCNRVHQPANSSQLLTYGASTITILRLLLCVRACMTYKREVTGSYSTRGKEVFFLGISGRGRYNRQPTDTASYGPSRN